MSRPDRTCILHLLTTVLLLITCTQPLQGQPLGATDDFEDGFAPADEVDIFYQMIGEGHPLLIINGGPGWSSDHMRSVAVRLARSHRVILFDQRGTGRSQPAAIDSTTIHMDAMVQDIEALRTHLGFDEWTVLGHSFGGMLAMDYAALYPDHVRALILSASPGADLRFTAWYQSSLNDRMRADERDTVARWSHPDSLAADPKRASYEIIRATAGAFLYDRSNLDSMLSVIDETTWSIQASNLVWADLGRNGFDVSSALETFDRPVLVLQGRQDALGDHLPHRIASLFSNSEMHIIEESAHIMWLDQPDRYFDLIDTFLMSSEQSRN